MSKRGIFYGLVGCAVLAGAALYVFDVEVPFVDTVKDQIAQHRAEKEKKAEKSVPPPAVTVVPATERAFVETVLVTGSIVPRETIVVVPEVEGLRIVELRRDEGEQVEAGDVLAVLEDKALRYQLEQRDAALKRAIAAIEQAKSQITDAKARHTEAVQALKRAKPLRRSKHIAESIYDQRQATAVSAAAQVASSEEGLRVAEANKAEIEAQQRELSWRVSRAIIRAPVTGLISKRNARIGAIAIGANAFSGDSPMFRIITKGEVELDAEVSEAQIANVKKGQPAEVEVSGVGSVSGKVRRVSPEIDKTTRLGRVRVFLGRHPEIKVGSFARGEIETRTSNGLAVPLSAVIFTEQGPSVLVVKKGQANTRLIKTGLVVKGVQEVTSGLNPGDLVVAKSGTFLRDGDAVRAIQPEAKVSEARR